MLQIIANIMIILHHSHILNITYFQNKTGSDS